jgi:hypothetical protein
VLARIDSYPRCPHWQGQEKVEFFYTVEGAAAQESDARDKSGKGDRSADRNAAVGAESWPPPRKTGAKPRKTRSRGVDPSLALVC